MSLGFQIDREPCFTTVCLNPATGEVVWTSDSGARFDLSGIDTGDVVSLCQGVDATHRVLAAADGAEVSLHTGFDPWETTSDTAAGGGLLAKPLGSGPHLFRVSGSTATVANYTLEQEYVYGPFWPLDPHLLVRRITSDGILSTGTLTLFKQHTLSGQVIGVPEWPFLTGGGIYPFFPDITFYAAGCGSNGHVALGVEYSGGVFGTGSFISLQVLNPDNSRREPMTGSAVGLCSAQYRTRAASGTSINSYFGMSGGISSLRPLSYHIGPGLFSECARGPRIAVDADGNVALATYYDPDGSLTNVSRHIGRVFDSGAGVVQSLVTQRVHDAHHAFVAESAGTFYGAGRLSNPGSPYVDAVNFSVDVATIAAGSPTVSAGPSIDCRQIRMGICDGSGVAFLADTVRTVMQTAVSPPSDPMQSAIGRVANVLYRGSTPIYVPRASHRVLIRCDTTIVVGGNTELLGCGAASVNWWRKGWNVRVRSCQASADGTRLVLGVHRCPVSRLGTLVSSGLPDWSAIPRPAGTAWYKNNVVTGSTTLQLSDCSGGCTADPPTTTTFGGSGSKTSDVAPVPIPALGHELADTPFTAVRFPEFVRTACDCP